VCHIAQRGRSHRKLFFERNKNLKKCKTENRQIEKTRKQKPLKNTPTEIIDKFNREIKAAPADPKMKTRLADLGSTVVAGSPADFGKLVADETEKWAKVVKFAGLKAD
jgi:hypothetical protein